MKSLRNGDWRDSIQHKTSHNIKVESCDDDTYVEQEIDCDDMRIEGTTAYLPPEVVLGEYPTVAADSWALGCLLFQCLSGRPPILEQNDFLTRQKIVSFSLSHDNESVIDQDLFHDVSTNVIFSLEAKSLIKRCLSANVDDRPTMFAVSEDCFFMGSDIFSLHMKDAYPLEATDAVPSIDNKWTRRQFSSIWSPHPQSYSFESIASTKNVKENFQITSNKILHEGDEASSYFCKVYNKVLLTSIDEA